MLDLQTISFSDEKDAHLRAQRGIGFKEIVTRIADGGLLDVLEHPSEKYPHQHIIVVDVEGYAYVVPCVMEGNTVFLKTVFASRTYTKLYLGKE